MASIFVNIENGVEVAAEDVLHFLTGVKVISTSLEPGVVAALAVLLGTLEKSMADLSQVIAMPLNIVLDVQTLNDIQQVWPALVKFAATLGIKL